MGLCNTASDNATRCATWIIIRLLKSYRDLDRILRTTSDNDIDLIDSFG